MELYWDEAPIHVIDFEGGPQCGIVEFGVVSIRGYSIESVATRLCRPRAEIPKSEEAVHGIRSPDAKKFSPFRDEWERFAAMRECGPFAAHFASAENGMLKAVFPYPRQSPSWTGDDRSVAQWGPWIDTGVLYRGADGGQSSLRLEELILSYGLQTELDALGREHCPSGRRGYHCALYDALASALLLTRFCRDAGEERMSLARLIARSQGNAARRERFEQRELF